jgi:hypothetical protein
MFKNELNILNLFLIFHVIFNSQKIDVGTVEKEKEELKFPHVVLKRYRECEIWNIIIYEDVCTF